MGWLGSIVMNELRDRREEEKGKMENWKFMGRTKAYIPVPSSSAHFKGHADDILSFHVRPLLVEDADRGNYWVHRAPGPCLYTIHTKGHSSYNMGGGAPRYDSFGGFDLNLTSYVCAQEEQKVSGTFECSSTLYVLCCVWGACLWWSVTAVADGDLNIDNTSIEDVLAMASRVAAGLEAKHEQSYTHPCSGSISVSLRSCMVSWCSRAAFTCPHTTHGSHEDTLCRSLPFLQMHEGIPTNGKGLEVDLWMLLFGCLSEALIR